MLKTLSQIEMLKELDNGAKSQEEKDAELLESIEGIGWSKEVFNELDWRLEDAKTELVDLAKQNSQWRSIIQTVFIIMASLSVGLVWLKLNNVASKGML